MSQVRAVNKERNMCQFVVPKFEIHITHLLKKMTRILCIHYICCNRTAACQPLDNLVLAFQLHARVIIVSPYFGKIKICSKMHKSKTLNAITIMIFNLRNIKDIFGLRAKGF
jgi:hypothetical protein